MNRTCIATFILLLTSASMAETVTPLCVLDLDRMPELWRPSAEAEKGLNPDPWSDHEAEDAVKSIRSGVDEMIDLYARRPEAIPKLWEDAVGSLIEVTYSSANLPALDEMLRSQARRVLSVLLDSYEDRDPASMGCTDYSDLLPLAVYAHNHYAADDARRSTAVVLTNAAYRACDSFSEAIDSEYIEVLADNDAHTDDVFDLVIWSLLFIEAQLVPDLELPDEAREFFPALWRYLENYHLAGAREYEEGAWDDEFIEMAYLATHIAYVPTGNHRHPIYIEDSPSLYSYLRENFYPSLQMGELDLVAELVDSFRQYGCTPKNDRQVRDGTRYLLKVFHDGGDRWMAYREEGETDADVDDYDLIHKAWTGVLGVRERRLDPSVPGTYGGVVRSWLPQPR